MLCAPCKSEGQCAWEAAGSVPPRLCPLTSAKRCSADGQPVDLSRFVAEPCDAADDTLIVTTHFNPCKFRRLRDTYHDWLPTLGPLADRLVCYELVLDDDVPEIDGSIVIRGTRREHWLWQKEALINRALRDCPTGIKYFAWLDHDLVIADRLWLDNATMLLDSGAVAVQLFDQITYLDRNRSPIGINTGRMADWIRIGKPKGNPGGVWISGVEYLRSIDGLTAINIVGGGDEVWFDAMTDVDGKQIPHYPQRMREAEIAWTDNARRVRGDRPPSFLAGMVYHLWHGDRSNRQYLSRHDILNRYDFDPDADVDLNADGLMQWASHKRELHSAVAEYFTDRAEDGEAL